MKFCPHLHSVLELPDPPHKLDEKFAASLLICKQGWLTLGLLDNKAWSFCPSSPCFRANLSAERI